MKFKGIIYKRITYLNENISYEKCPECSSEFSTGLVEDPDSIEYIKGLFSGVDPSGWTDGELQLTC